MKNIKIVILTAIAFFIIIIILLFKFNNKTVINCCDKVEAKEPCKHRSAIPNHENLRNTMLYYNLGDKCNFQTLVFQTCFDRQTRDGVKIPPEKHNAYSILGRFNGEKLNETQSIIYSLEVKHIFLDQRDNVISYRIGNMEVLPESKSDKIQIVFELVKKKGEGEEELYIYGIRDNEKPIIVDRDATISFYVRDSEDGILKSIGCTNISPEIRGRGISGGYECDGKPTWPPGGP